MAIGLARRLLWLSFMSGITSSLSSCAVHELADEPAYNDIFPPVYLVFEITSPRSSVKYGRSSRKNLHLRTRFSRVWYAESSPPRSSDSLVIRRHERLKVDYATFYQLLDSPLLGTLMKH